MQEIDELLQAISALEAQRQVLGDRVVDAALVPLREKLAILQGREPVTQQRRLVTMLFTDIVDSTLMSQGLEPEEVLEIMDGALKRLSAPVDAYGGQVTRFMGDGFLAVFGLTRVHENDARQAVRAGLAIMTESRLYAQDVENRLHVPGFDTRIGINTGWVAAGGFSEAEATIMGLNVSLAARMEEAAQPGALFITQSTYQHVRGAFDVEALPEIEAKGFPEPINVYKVIAARPRTFRTVTRGVEGIETSLIGREAELHQLQEVLSHTIHGVETRLVTVIGEAGVGKSRLLYEFDRWVAQVPSRIIAFKVRSSPQMTSVPYATLRDLICYRLGVLTTDPVEVTRQRMIDELSDFIEEEPELKADFVGSLLGFDFSNSPYLQGVESDPKQFQERAQRYLIQYINAITSQYTTVLMLDDIHWSDELSLGFITQLVQECPNLPLLVVCLARPSLLERYPSWGMDVLGAETASPTAPIQGSLKLTLGSLTPECSRELLDEILGDAGALPDEMRDHLLHNAGGNPYYLEEFIQALLDAKAIRRSEPGGTWKLDPDGLRRMEMPTTLIALLEARLDSLSASEKALVQQASVIGQVFWHSTLQALHGDEPILEGELKTLTKRGLIYLQETTSFSGTDEYHFHHGLLRDVAYQTLFKSVRQGYHAKVADWLIGATQNAGRVGEFAPIIAEHYELSGKSVLAAEWYTNAGARTKSQGAPVQALTFYNRALELLSLAASPSSPDDNFERRWQALSGRDEVLGNLGETEKRMADDAALVSMAESAGDDCLLAEAYYRQGYYLGVIGQYQKEHEAYVSGLAAAVRAQDRKREAMILGLKVFCEVRLDDLETAARTALEALQCAEELGDDEVLARILINVSPFYTHTGDIGRTTQLLERGLSIIRRIGNIEGEAITLSNLSYVYILLGMTDEAIPALQRCIKLSQAIDHRSFLAYGSLNLGLAHLRGDDPSSAIAELGQCLVEFEAMNDVIDHSTCQTYAAMARERTGRISEALAGFERAAGKLEEIGIIGYAYDAKAGIARCLLALNNLEAARQQAALVWDYLQQGKVGMEFPILGYETCADIFEAAGEATMARRIIEAGYHELITRAHWISLPELRQSYLERVPEHQRIQARWQEYSNTSQV